jgi:hypothetical protein
MAVTRESDGDALEACLAGGVGFWRGEPLDPGRTTDWTRGWLAAAENARSKVAAAGPLIDQSGIVIALLQECQAAMAQAAGYAKLGPGLRARLNRAGAQVATLLAQLSPAAAAADTPRRRGSHAA